MKVVTSFHPPSAVSHSLRCCLDAESQTEYLVVAKLDCIDIFSLQAEGRKHECHLDVWGNILSLRAVPVAGSAHSKLLVMVDHPEPELIFLDYQVSVSGTPELSSTHNLSLHERIPRHAEFFNNVLVEPTGKIALASCYAGKVRVVLLKHGGYDTDFDASLPEINILTAALLHTSDEYIIVILHVDSQERIQLISRTIDTDTQEISSAPTTLLLPTILPKSFQFNEEFLPHLIHITGSEDPAEAVFPGGVLVTGGRKLLFYELSSKEKQDKQKGKSRRAENRKNSPDKAAVSKVKEKERDREGRKRKPNASIEWPWSDIVCSCTVDSSSGRYLLADAYGRLVLLSASRLDQGTLILLPLGETSSASTMTYLTAQTLFLGSEHGESQLIHINATPISALDTPTFPIPPGTRILSTAQLVTIGRDKDSEGGVVEGNGNYLTILESYKNLGPILDAILVDVDGSGRKQAVTCSGGRHTGSINLVRAGAEFQELAVISGISDVTQIWSIRRAPFESPHMHVVVSTSQNTYLFRFDNANTLTRVESVSNGLVGDEPSLVVANVARRYKLYGSSKSLYADSDLLVQITPKGIHLLEYEIGLSEYVQVGQAWRPEDHILGDGSACRGHDIVAADANQSQIVLALSGAILVYLNLEDQKICCLASTSTGKEISAISCSPLDPASRFTLQVAVSFWELNVIELFSFSNGGFTSICKTPQLPSLPRSLLFHNFGRDQNPTHPDYHPYLVAGLTNGTAATFAYRDKQLRDQKTVPLGDAPVCIATCEVDERPGVPAVLASGSRALVFYWDKQRLLQSPIALKHIVAASSLNAEYYKSSVILATSSSLFIGKVRGLDKMHVKSISLMRDIPRRIDHHPQLKVFGVACTRTNPARIGEIQATRSSFKLLDDISFNILMQWSCEPYEEITAVKAVPAVTSSTPCFVLGTCCYGSEIEPTEGRLLIFTENEEQRFSSPRTQLYLASALQTNGAVCALALSANFVIAAVNASVVLYNLDFKDTSFTVQKVAEWTHNYFVTSVVSAGNTIVVGDAISSVSLLKIEGRQLQMIAKDYGPVWPICLEALTEASVIGANIDANLFTFSLHDGSEHRKVLECDGSYNAADMITKFLSGSITSVGEQEEQLFKPIQVFFTSSGRIGVILDVADQQVSLQMTALQRNMAGILKGPGSITHTHYRAPKNSRGRSDGESASFGFLDGDFLEQYLEWETSEGFIEKVLAGQSEAERLLMSRAQIQKALESLRSRH